MCSLFIPEEDKVVNIACEHLEPVSPEKGDRVSTEGIESIPSIENRQIIRLNGIQLIVFSLSFLG